MPITKADYRLSVRVMFLILGTISCGSWRNLMAEPLPSVETAIQRQYRDWTDRARKHHTEAAFVELKVTIAKRDGTSITIPLKSLSDADQEYVFGLCKQSPKEYRAEDGTPTAASPKPAHAKRTRKQPLPQPEDVIVTGVGTAPEQAVKNAFSQAIEQTVGLLVNAETVVENDELIRDEVLTYSRDYVEKYEVVSRWQADGLHHAKIRAVIARDKWSKSCAG